MNNIRLGTRRTKQVALLAGVGTFFFITGIVILLVSETPVYALLSTLAFLGGLAVISTAALGILLKQRATANRMRTQMKNLTKILMESQAAQQEMTQNLNALTASQTRLWDDFERSNNPQLMLKK